MIISLPEALKTALGYCVPMLLVASCGASHAEGESADERTFVHSRRRVTVSAYCEKFAKRYSALNALEYQERSVRAEKRSDVMMRIGNLFQPADSRFTSGYDCRFRAGRQGERAWEISVGLFLTGTRRFAEHTKWKDLQIVPIEPVVDETHDRAGYGVFKYLKDP